MKKLSLDLRDDDHEWDDYVGGRRPVELAEANPYHDEKGRFTSGGGSGIQHPLNAKERDAVNAYRHQAAYITINQNLRKGRALSETDRAIVRHLDAAIAKSEVTKSMTVYRGVSALGVRLAEAATGTVFVDKGYMSTTASKAKAESFGKYGRVLEITVGPGMSLLDARAGGRSPVGYGGEREFILPRGARLEKLGMRGDIVRLKVIQ